MNPDAETRFQNHIAEFRFLRDSSGYPPSSRRPKLAQSVRPLTNTAQAAPSPFLCGN